MENMVEIAPGRYVNAGYRQQFDPNNPGDAAYLARLAALGGNTGAPITNVSTGRTLQTPQTQTTAQTTPVPDTNSITALLQRYQRLGSQMVASGQMEQVNRAMRTDPGLIGANPSLQNSTRNASVNAVEPTIGGARNLVSEAKAALEEYQMSVEKSRDNARQVINQILTSTDLDSIRSLDPKELESLEKLSGYPKGFLQSALQFKSKDGGADGGINGIVTEAGGRKLLINPRTGVTIRDLGAADGSGSGTTGGKSAATSSIIDVLNELIADPNLPNITGLGQNPLNAQFLGRLTNAKTLNKYDQLKGMLALENRQQLKGSGAISDFEFRVLGQASSALGRNLKNEDLLAELINLRDTLTAGEAGAAGTSSGVTAGGVKWTVQ